ncbi:hypothetical protein Bca52824_046300 [Brassica carinata]|uniref:Uncharacterized protein n=1 Tax=Brassica carinata TaxID=52824 RepID=A0A8X7UR06_BRACI|nr:hypothetical protein Bca52824_046300 [Brassica carinata]
MNHPTSLLSRIYRAKYFRKSTFLEAKAFPSSSYAWRSIVQTQPLINKGAKWVIGNGLSVRVWKDNWLQGDCAFPPIGPRAEIYPMMTVKDLFLSGTRMWDIAKIRRLVRAEDVPRILQIRPSETGQQDILCWRLGTSGTYTVKTGYQLQRTMDLEAQTTQLSSHSQDRSYCFPFFLGWRIWKARNKLVFENKRDHITQIVNAAVMDSKIWKEALTQNKETEQTDIEAVATKCNFSFRHAPRNLLDVVDKLVKDARIGNKPYVITWLNSSAILCKCIIFLRLFHIL